MHNPVYKKQKVLYKPIIQKKKKNYAKRWNRTKIKKKPLGMPQVKAVKPYELFKPYMCYTYK